MCIRNKILFLIFSCSLFSFYPCLNAKPHKTKEVKGEYIGDIGQAPTTTLQCRFRTPDKGQMIELPGLEGEKPKEYSGSEKPTAQFFWSCPDAGHPAYRVGLSMCPHYLSYARYIFTDIYFVVNDAKDHPLRKQFFSQAVAACENAKKDYFDANGIKLELIEFGTKSSADYFPKLFHRPYFTKIRDLKDPNGYPLPFVRMVVFGDSLSDSGNAYDAYVRANTWMPEFLEWPYYAGRPSNGPTWVEDIAKRIRIKENTSFDLLNYAETGAGIVSFAYNPIGDLETQISNYFETMDALNRNFGVDPAYDKTLFVILVGSNDYMMLSGTGDAGRLLRERYCLKNNADACANAVVNGNDTVFGIKGDIKEIIERAKKANKNAKYFIVPTQPDISKAPYYTTQTPLPPDEESKFVHEASQAHNRYLQEAIGELKTSYPDINILSTDFYALINNFIENPNNEIMLKSQVNVTDRACFPAGPTGPFDDENLEKMCDDPASYLFWDQIHPSMTTHCNIAEFVLAEIYEQFGKTGSSYEPKYEDCHNSYTHKYTHRN